MLCLKYFIVLIVLIACATCDFDNDKSVVVAQNDHPHGDIKPILECIMTSPSSGFTNAYFGFESKELDTVEIPVGVDNRISPAPEDRSQTEIFINRRSRHFPMAAFYVPFQSGGTLTWHLNGYEVTASSDDNICITDWMAYKILILQNNPPSNATLESIREISDSILGTEEGQLEITSKLDSPTLYEIVVNITEVEGAISPLAAMITLFGSNSVYDEYTNILLGMGLVPQEIDTMEVGIEKFGKEPSSSPSPGGGPSAPSPEDGGDEDGNDGSPSPPPRDPPVDGGHTPPVQTPLGEPVAFAPSSDLKIKSTLCMFIAIGAMLLWL